MNDPAADTAADARPAHGMPDASPAPPPVAVMRAFLTFRVAEDEYGIDILKVHEIVGLLPVTPLHGSPREVSGVINLRGNVVPVLSLRALFSLAAGAPSPHHVFIILNHEQELIGLAVDRVLDVVRFSQAQIAPPGSPRTGIDPVFIAALATGHGRAVHVLAIEQILGFPSIQAPSR